MPTIAASLKALPVNNMILDGELVVVDAKGLRAVVEPYGQANASQRTARLLRLRSVYLDAFDLRGSSLIDRNA